MIQSKAGNSHFSKYAKLVHFGRNLARGKVSFSPPRRDIPVPTGLPLHPCSCFKETLPRADGKSNIFLSWLNKALRIYAPLRQFDWTEVFSSSDRDVAIAASAQGCAVGAADEDLSPSKRDVGQNSKFGGNLFRTIAIIFLTIFSINVSAAEVGKQAPDFTLKTNSGKNLKLSEQVGNVLLVNFWASWCGPCRQEMPLLETLQQKYEDLGFSIIAINVDENSELADKFLSSIEVTYPILYDNTAQVSQQFNVAAMPTTFILDRDGKVRFVHKGFKPGYEKKYEKEVKQLVRE